MKRCGYENEHTRHTLERDYVRPWRSVEFAVEEEVVEGGGNVEG